MPHFAVPVLLGIAVLPATAPAGSEGTPVGVPPYSAVEWTPVAFKDGTFVGPAIDAYWGEVQIQAVVQNGQIVSLGALHYPSDRRESLRISQYALPRLRDEVVKAQAARVDVITGATLTSEAFMRSLEGALSQAGGPAPSPSPQPIEPPARRAFDRGFGI